MFTEPGVSSSFIPNKAPNFVVAADSWQTTICHKGTHSAASLALKAMWLEHKLYQHALTLSGKY